MPPPPLLLLLLRLLLPLLESLPPSRDMVAVMEDAVDDDSERNEVRSVGSGISWVPMSIILALC